MDSQLENKQFVFQISEANMHLLGFPLAGLTVLKVSKMLKSVPHTMYSNSFLCSFF